MSIWILLTTSELSNVAQRLKEKDRGCFCATLCVSINAYFFWCKDFGLRSLGRHTGMLFLCREKTSGAGSHDRTDLAFPSAVPRTCVVAERCFGRACCNCLRRASYAAHQRIPLEATGILAVLSSTHPLSVSSALRVKHGGLLRQLTCLSPFILRGEEMGTKGRRLEIYINTQHHRLDHLRSLHYLPHPTLVQRLKRPNK